MRPLIDLFEVEPAGLEGINTVFMKKIAPRLPELERQRKRALLWGHVRMLFMAGPLAIVLLVGVIAGLFRLVSSLNLAMTVLSLRRRIGRVISEAYEPAEDVKLKHRHLVLDAIAEFLEVTYNPRGIPGLVGKFQTYGILPSGRKARCEDGFDGEINGTPFLMTETELLYERSDGDIRGDRTDFQGLCISIALPKRFEGRTLAIAGDTRWMGARFWADNDFQEIRLEDPGFESTFRVYAGSQIEARYLLTPSMMERLSVVSRRHKGMVALFADGCLHLVLGTADGFNAGGIWHDLTDPTLVREALEDLLYAGSIIAELSVNAEARV